MIHSAHTDHEVIDSEHQGLHGVLTALRDIIVADVNGSVVADAVIVMKERLRLHCRSEENEAQACGMADISMLQRSHDALLSALSEVECRVAGNVGERQRAVDAFIALAMAHEHEVDIPLFRSLEQFSL